MWEVPLLAVISELVHHYRSPEISVGTALETLEHKLADFADMTADIDMSAFRLMDFWHPPPLLPRSTAGYRAALAAGAVVCRHQQLRSGPPIEFNPDGYPGARMVPGPPADRSNTASSQRAALAARLAEYPDQLGIALTDCITMDAFLRDFGPEFATRYQGLRHDSGDPLEWGEKAIAHYQKLGIDPMSKVLVFSDNLDLGKAVDLYRHFSSRVKLSFGIGTRLTCDIPQVKPLNIVIKLVECNGKPVAKLSDSPGKNHLP